VGKFNPVAAEAMINMPRKLSYLDPPTPIVLADEVIE
jgi:hypothetical protein